jgi:hypothetical protein
VDFCHRASMYNINKTNSAPNAFLSQCAIPRALSPSRNPTHLVQHALPHSGRTTQHAPFQFSGGPIRTHTHTGFIAPHGILIPQSPTRQCRTIKSNVVSFVTCKNCGSRFSAINSPHCTLYGQQVPRAQQGAALGKRGLLLL